MSIFFDIEVRDHDPRRALSGLLAVQVHTGPPMKVKNRNVRLRQFNNSFSSR